MNVTLLHKSQQWIPRSTTYRKLHSLEKGTNTFLLSFSVSRGINIATHNSLALRLVPHLTEDSRMQSPGWKRDDFQRGRGSHNTEACPSHLRE